MHNLCYDHIRLSPDKINVAILLLYKESFIVYFQDLNKAESETQALVSRNDGLQHNRLIYYTQ